MTVYFNELLSQIELRQGRVSARELMETMVALGLIDYTLCKVLAVREEVAYHISRGHKKVDAMWKATEKFCCSYEYVRKCMYYYTDINLPGNWSEVVENKIGDRGLISRENRQK